MNRNELYYKGYTGSVEWSEADKGFHGSIKGISGHFHYEGNTIDELRNDFINSIEKYLDYCKNNDIKPEKPYKGNFNVKLGTDLHGLTIQIAEAEGISLNKLLCNALKEYLM